jgi:hypothetical protein
MTKEWKPTHYITNDHLFEDGDQTKIEVMLANVGTHNAKVYDRQGYRWGLPYTADVQHLIPITSEPPSVSKETKFTTALKTVYKCPKCGERNSIELSFVGDLKS